MGREKCEKYPKNKRNLLLFGGEIQNLGGEFPPLKALKKTLPTALFCIMIIVSDHIHQMSCVSVICEQTCACHHSAVDEVW